MRKKILGGLVALALAVAPAAAASAAPYPPSADELHGWLDVYTGAPGDTVTYTALEHTYAPAEALTQKIYGLEGHAASPAEAVFTEPAAADGSHTFAFTIPLDARDGDQYVVQVLRADGSVWDSFVVTAVVSPADTVDPGPGQDAGSGADPGTGSGADPVVDTGSGSGSNAAGSGGGSALAMTGSDIAVTGIASGAVLLLGAGIALLVIRRRRSRTDAAA